MKRTYNIDIAGEAFIIDDDAYALLNDYLDTLKHAFSNTEGGQQVQEDIESRISELLSEHIALGYKVISLDEVNMVINRIGRPEEIIDRDEISASKPMSECVGNENLSEEYSEVLTGTVPPPPPIKKKLYRDPKEKILGGVCSGIAHYLGIDTVWVRLFAVIVGFISFSTLLIAYIILWIIIPAAETPYQRMQMYGCSPTLHEIGTAVSNFFKTSNPSATAAEAAGCGTPLSDDNPAPQKGYKRFADVLTRMVGVALKVILVAIGILAVPVLLSAILGIVFVICLAFADSHILFQLVDSVQGYSGIVFQYRPVLWIIFLICSLMAVAIPCLALIWCAYSVLNGKVSFPRKWGLSLLIIWLLTLCGTTISGAFIYNDSNAVDRSDHLIDCEIIEDSDTVVDTDTDSLDLAIENMNSQLDSISEDITHAFEASTR